MKRKLPPKRLNHKKLYIFLTIAIITATASATTGNIRDHSIPTRQRDIRTFSQRSNTQEDIDECAQTDSKNPQDEEETFRCVLKRWYDKMSGGNTRKSYNDRDRVFRSLPNLADFKSERPYNASGGYRQDCLFYNRGVRPYPGTCYKPVQMDRKKYTIPADLEKTFTEFFREIAGDLMYTFDFVLWSENNDIHNNFWYLILYLKELAISIDNPMDIVSRQYHEAQMGKVDEKLTTANETLTRHSDNLDSLEKSLVKLSGQISNYQNIMTTLQNKLNKIISSMPYDQVDQNTLLGKLNYLSMQSILVGGLFNNSQNHDQTLLSVPDVSKVAPLVKLPIDSKHPYYKYNPLEKIISSQLDTSPKYYQNIPVIEKVEPQNGQNPLQDTPLQPSNKPKYF